MAAVINTAEISNSFNNGKEFFSSFGVNPGFMFNRWSSFKHFRRWEFTLKTNIVGKFLIQRLALLQTKYQELANIRGDGLFIGIEILDQMENLARN